MPSIMSNRRQLVLLVAEQLPSKAQFSSNIIIPPLICSVRCAARYRAITKEPTNGTSPALADRLSLVEAGHWQHSENVHFGLASTDTGPQLSLTSKLSCSVDKVRLRRSHGNLISNQWQRVDEYHCGVTFYVVHE